MDRTYYAGRQPERSRPDVDQRSPDIQPDNDVESAEDATTQQFEWEEHHISPDEPRVRSSRRDPLDGSEDERRRKGK